MRGQTWRHYTWFSLAFFLAYKASKKLVVLPLLFSLHHHPKLLLLSRSQLPSLLAMLKAMTNFVVDTKFITTLSDCAVSGCDCLLEDADDPNVCCVLTRASDIALLVDLGDLKALKEISYHSFPNAFTPLCFGANIYGINGCCPGENLHMVQKSLMSYALVAFYQNVLTEAPTMFLDKFCKEISTIMSCQSDCNYPRTPFPHPLSMLSQLRARKYI